jgi:hypothetical protein
MGGTTQRKTNNCSYHEGQPRRIVVSLLLNAFEEWIAAITALRTQSEYPIRLQVTEKMEREMGLEPVTCSLGTLT